MTAVLVGASGFLLFYPTDWLHLRGWATARFGLLVLGAAAQAYAFLLAVGGAQGLEFPTAVVWLGWVLLPVAGGLLVYSLFLEIPFTNAYLRPPNALREGGELVTTGTYALTRHPGVLWYTLLVFALVLVSGSRDMLVGAPVWVAMDVVWVVLQDRVFFPRIFSRYREYARTTPMLIPTRGSLAACLATLGPRRRHTNFNARTKGD